MNSVLKEAEHLRGTPAYSALRTAAEYMDAYRQGMLVPESLDAVKLLRPCLELRQVDPDLARRAAEALRDFCLEVDRLSPVDRSMWIVLGQLCRDDPFSVFEEYPVSVLREENWDWEGLLQPWDRRALAEQGLASQLTDPAVYAAAAAYIRRRGRARFAVRRWLMIDMDRRYGEHKEPAFPDGKVLSFCREPDAVFQPGAAPAEPYRRGQRVKLRLTDEKGMDFLPEVRILSDRRCGGGREARAWAWYRGDRWLLRICYDLRKPEEARVNRYVLYPLEFMGFHVLAFVVLGGDYRRQEPLKKGDRIRVKLMDLWGRDVPLAGTVGEVHRTAIDFRAVFPDGRERGVTVYLAEKGEYRRDVAVVERWEQYPLPRWAAGKPRD